MQGVRACTCTGSAYRGSTQHFPAQQRRVATKRVIAPRATASSSPEQQPKATPHPLTRRALVAGVTAGVPLFMSTAPALAVKDGAPAEVDSIPAFELESFGDDGWIEMGSGLLYQVVRKGEGDREKGIFDKVDHFQPFPFVTVQYTAYTPNGKAFASSYMQRRPWNYQVGIRSEVQDEDGAVMSMVVGERRRFVVPQELLFKQKVFGVPVPSSAECILVDVELLFLQPY